MSWIYRIKWTSRMLWKTSKELISDLYKYYFTTYPFLLIIGAFRRLKRRMKIIWIPRGKGRPQVSDEICNLILDMKRSNYGWGALRISQELALLGIKVSKTTVAKILKINGFIPPKTRMTQVSWKAFFENHKHIWAIDFHCVHDIKGNQVFVFVIIDIITRELVSINATLNPNHDWIIRQFLNASCDFYTFPSALIADNDGIYGKWLDQILKNYLDINVHRIPHNQPWKNGRCERLHLNIKIEILKRVDLKDAAHIRELCFNYQEYYNQKRPHQTIDGERAGNKKSLVKQISTTDKISYEKKSLVSDLIVEFKLAA